MKRIGLFLSLLWVLCIGVFSMPAVGLLEDIQSGKFAASGLKDIQILPDPSRYARLSEDGKRLLICDFTSGKEVEVMVDLSEESMHPMKHMTGFRFSKDATKILLWDETTPLYRRSFLTTYYVFDVRRSRMSRLTEKPLQRDADFSPDGRSVSFIHENNLYIKRLDFGSELQVTDDGAFGQRLHAVTDWVYEEEFGFTKAYDWSKDGTYVAFLSFDESNVSQATYPVYGAFRHREKGFQAYPDRYSYRYPVAGTNNSVVSLSIYHLQTRSTRTLTLPDADVEYIPGIRFTEQDDQLAVFTLNRRQDRFRMFFVNPKSGVYTLALTEQGEFYVDPDYQSIQFGMDFFVSVGEKDGYRHLYLYGIHGGPGKALTSGKWEVTQFYGVDAKAEQFYFQANREGLDQRDVYRVDRKGRIERLSPGQGVKQALFNSDGSRFLLRVSDRNTPWTVFVCDAKGAVLKKQAFDQSVSKQILDLNLPKKERVSFEAVDGQSIHGWMIRPDEKRYSGKRPAILLQYSGPDSQSTLDEFKLNWEYVLADQGFVVLSVDGRGTGGRGTAFRQQTYLKLGALESEDQYRAAEWLGKRPFVDAQRLGIWGWSYGGFVTLLSMSNADSPFAAGIAVAPVTDFRYYNTVYTERYMRRPSENLEGYTRFSPLQRASELKGQLLLIHGMADDNVRANQSMDYAEALIEAGKDFDSQWYPVSNHSILGEVHRIHLYRKMLRFFTIHLKP
ncbi:MAG: DPP IV N-terminal domain-containing protein [Bacteroidales bacterium]